MQYPELVCGPLLIANWNSSETLPTEKNKMVCGNIYHINEKNL